MELVVVTRESKLALAQTNQVVSHLQKSAEISCRLLPTTTLGDTYRDRWEEFCRSTVATVGLAEGSKFGATVPEITKRKWIFELEEALATGAADIAIHSGKDIPDTIREGTRIVPILPRAVPNDTLVFKNEALWREFLECMSSRNSSSSARDFKLTIGTSSKRRAAELRCLLPAVKVVELRGNVTTRLEKLQSQPDLDAIVLAACGLERCGISVPYQVLLDPEDMLPAMNQGILVAQTRTDDCVARTALARLVDQETLLAWAVERACVEELGVGCDTAFGVYARFEGAALVAVGRGVSPGGEKSCEKKVRGLCHEESEARRLGRDLAALLRKEQVFSVMSAMSYVAQGVIKNF